MMLLTALLRTFRNYTQNSGFFLLALENDLLFGIEKGNKFLADCPFILLLFVIDG